MALIICPKCGKQYSDKANACPQCGRENKPAFKVCPECETQIPFDSRSCPNCGCPFEVESPGFQKVEVTNINLSSMDKQKKKKMTIIIISVVALLIIGVISVLVIKKIQKDKAEKAAEEQRIQEEQEAEKKAKEYKDNLNLITQRILSSAVKIEEAGSLIHDVWNDAIWDEVSDDTEQYVKGASDFNEALANLFADSFFQSDLKVIKDDKDYIDGLMKKMLNPPDEYKEAYDQLKSLYDTYNSFYSLVQSPSGSLQSYTSDFNDCDSDILSEYNKMQLYLD